MKQVQLEKLSSRRQFLKQLSVAIGAISASSFILPKAYAQVNAEMFTQTRLLMGTVVTIKAVDVSQDKALQSMSLAFDEVARLEALLTRHNSSSPLAYLNTHGKLSDAPQELLHVVKEAQQVETLTSGAFNPSVLPLLKELEKNNSISEKELIRLSSLVQRNASQVRGNSLQLKSQDMQISLDGIAKGYIVDRVAHMLDTCGMQAYLINAGGDIRAKGLKSQVLGQKWTVAVEDPYKQGNYPSVLPLVNGAMATSGSYEKNFKNSWSHLITPSYNNSNAHSSSIKSVSVIAPTAMQADALATAFSCMPVAHSLSLVNKLPQVSCFIIDSKDAIYKSSQWSV